MGSPSNIFFVKGKKLHTPTPNCFLDGITRRTIIDIAKSKNLNISERTIKVDELENFDGCFLTGTAAEITPVSQINDYQFKVVDIIKDLSAAYQSLVKKEKAA